MLSGWRPASLGGGPAAPPARGDEAERAQLLGASHGAEAGLRAAWSPGPRGGQRCGSSRALMDRGVLSAGPGGREAWEAGPGPGRSLPAHSSNLSNLSPGVTGRAAAPLQRPFPGRCLGRRRKTLAETRWGGSAAHTAGGVPRLTVRPAVRGQEMTRPVAVLLRRPRHRRLGAWSGPGSALPPAATPPLDSSQLA